MSIKLSLHLIIKLQFVQLVNLPPLPQASGNPNPTSFHADISPCVPPATICQLCRNPRRPGAGRISDRARHSSDLTQVMERLLIGSSPSERNRDDTPRHRITGRRRSDDPDRWTLALGADGHSSEALTTESPGLRLSQVTGQKGGRSDWQ